MTSFKSKYLASRTRLIENVNLIFKNIKIWWNLMNSQEYSDQGEQKFLKAKYQIYVRWNNTPGRSHS